MEDTLAEHLPQTRRVLLVDDEDRFVAQLSRLLEKRNFHVTTAQDGSQALALIEDRSFDAVVLDIRMPVMDGMTALGRIQEKKSSPAVIMLTGHATLETGIEAIRHGAFDYLMKPCDIEDLVAKLNLACTVGQIRRRLILWPRSLAGELILDAFRRIEDTDPLLEAFSILNHRLPRMAGETLFVVDKNNRLAGHLSKQDIVDRAARLSGFKTITWGELSANPQWLPDLKVGEGMCRDTVSVEPATPLKQVAEIMMEKGIRTLPVTGEDRQVLGVIRLRDVLVYLDGDDGTTDERFEE
jgi:two-component system, NtrC family, response regulator HydG